MTDETSLLGATVGGGGVTFCVWAPAQERIQVVVQGRDPVSLDPCPVERTGEGGYHVGWVAGVDPGELYHYRLADGRMLPDPASRSQPRGVHGPSEVIDPSTYRWRDQSWTGVPRPDWVLYELHVGTFSPAGTFDGVRGRLGHLRDLGVTAIELMPVADFPGRRNWGYDPAAWFAPAAVYGRPDELRRLVDAAHERGLAVVLDVVYNHFSPDGAYAPAYGPYLTDAHRTPWGQALKLEGSDAHGVRRFIIESAIRWLTEYHVDGLRLDATFALVDRSSPHLLAELAEAVSGLPGPERTLIAEDDRNLRTLVEPRSSGGYGLDAVWSDDFHHQVRTAVAGDRHGYFQDYDGTAAGLAMAITRGWIFSGQRSRYRGKARGTDPDGLDKTRFVFCIQNHDQVGNRAEGDRLSHGVEMCVYRAVSALLLLVPELPLLFMGQEWAASTPFQYFTDHPGDLGERVRRGRRRDLAALPRFRASIPDPQAEATFACSRLDWAEIVEAPHSGTLALYRDLLQWRRRLTGPARVTPVGPRALVVDRAGSTLLVALQPHVFSPRPAGVMAWHTEDVRYAQDNPTPPSQQTGSVCWKTAGAALFVQGSATP